jgi:hypothetical protein
MVAVASAAAAFNGVEELGEALVRGRWRLPPATAVETAGRGGAVGAGGGGGGGGRRCPKRVGCFGSSTRFR